MASLDTGEKRRGPPRKPKRPEENVPSGDYVEKLLLLGPREGESFLAYKKRMFMIEGTRNLWCRTWRQYGGNKVDIAAALGIPPNNIAHELRMVGLSARLLDQYLLGNVEILS